MFGCILGPWATFTRVKSKAEIRNLSAFSGSVRWTSDLSEPPSHKEPEHRKSHICGYLYITYTYVLYTQTWVLVDKAGWTLIDLHLHGLWDWVKTKNSPFTEMLLSLHTILDYYILYRIKRRTEPSVCKEEEWFQSAWWSAWTCSCSDAILLLVFFLSPWRNLLTGALKPAGCECRLRDCGLQESSSFILEVMLSLSWQLACLSDPLLARPLETPHAHLKPVFVHKLQRVWLSAQRWRGDRGRFDIYVCVCVCDLVCICVTIRHHHTGCRTRCCRAKRWVWYTKIPHNFYDAIEG